MSMRMLIVAFLPLMSILLTACESTPAMPGSSRPLAILKEHRGNDAGLPGPDAIVVRSREQLAALGSTELINQSIDFTNRSLVLVTLGQRPTGGYAVRLHSAQLHGNNLYVQGVAVEPGPDAVATQALTHPYAAVEVNRLPANVMVHPEIETIIDGER